MPGIGRRTAEAVVAALATRAARPTAVPAFDPVDRRGRGLVSDAAPPARAGRGLRACPAPAAPPPPSAWRTSAASSSTTSRRRCWPTMVDLGCRSQGAVGRIAVVVDVRAAAFCSDLRGALEDLADRGVDAAVLFLEAADDALVARFESVRRPHPLQGDGRLVDGIARERALLRDLRGEADLVLDTSRLNVHQLRARSSRPSATAATRRRAAADGAVVRLQARAAGRRRPRARRALPAQPALGARAAAADRPATRPCATTCSASPARAEFLDRYEACSAGLRGLRARGQALRPAGGRLHRRQAPQRRHRRGAGGAAGRRRASRCRSCTATWGASERAATGVARVVALGGGHGLAASLQALRQVTAAAHRRRHRRRRRRLQRPAAGGVRRPAARRPAHGAGGAGRRRRVGAHLGAAAAAPLPRRTGRWPATPSATCCSPG